jgi:hypothetical protein
LLKLIIKINKFDVLTLAPNPLIVTLTLTPPEEGLKGG